MGLKQLKQALKKDEAYDKFQNILKHCESLAEFKNLSKELETMHASRKSRNLHLSKPNLKRLMEASLQASSFRSRCVEIMSNVMKAQRLLESAIDRIEAHISANYRDQMGVRSQADRKTLLKALLQKAYYELADYNRIVEMARLIVDDIDQSAWALKHTLDALNILYTRESILGSGKKL